MQTAASGRAVASLGGAAMEVGAEPSVWTDQWIRMCKQRFNISSVSVFEAGRASISPVRVLQEII